MYEWVIVHICFNFEKPFRNYGLQHTATHCNTLEIPRYSTLQTYCNILQHTTVPHYSTLEVPRCNALPRTAMHYRTLQHTQHSATYCKTLHHTATRCNTLGNPRYNEPYPMIRHVKKSWHTNWFLCQIFLFLETPFIINLQQIVRVSVGVPPHPFIPHCKGRSLLLGIPSISFH